MGTVLIAMPKSDDSLRIEGLIQGYGLMVDTKVCNTGAEILRVANDRDAGVVVCAKRMRDMSYGELMDYLPESFGMIVLTKDASIETFTQRMVKLMLPMRTSDLISSIEMFLFDCIRPRKKKKPPAKKSDADKQIIEKAKLVLMDRNGMTEPEAFRYIQKSSMDSETNMVETAQMILLLIHDE